jgi:hypothetical protein
MILMTQENQISVSRPVAFHDRFLTPLYKKHANLPNSVVKRVDDRNTLQFTLLPTVTHSSPISNEIFWNRIHHDAELHHLFNYNIQGAIESIAIRSLSVLLIPDQDTQRRIRQETAKIAEIFESYDYAQRAVTPHISTLTKNNGIAITARGESDIALVTAFADDLQQLIKETDKKFVAFKPTLKIFPASN